MALVNEVGRYLNHLRTEARITQREVAERASIYPGVLSKIESGERAVTDDEMQRIVAALGTEGAGRFGQTWQREWANLERPQIGHPNEELLWEGENCLARIKHLREQLSIGPDSTDPFQARLSVTEQEITRAAELVRNLEHTIAFTGDIGVGKTTALCAISGLQVSRTAGGRRIEVLEVGTGRTTVCEVQMVQGPVYGLMVESLTDEEVEREVFEFADFLKRTVENSDSEDNGDRGATNSGSPTGDPTFPGTTREISRCIRNMSQLTVPRDRIDPAMELARTAQDTTTLAGEIVSRMNLQGRRRRRLEYSPQSGREPLVWLEEIFRQVNNGRHPEFSIPRMIEVTIPANILDEEVLKLRLVDTKGIDTTVERADLEDHLSNPRAVVVLCTGFNDAPAVTTQALLERAERVGIDDLDIKTAVLVIVRHDEALGVKYDDGTEVDTVREGCALKADQVWMQLGVRNVSCASVEFFNCKDETPDRVKKSLLKLVWTVREQHCRELRDVIRDASAMVDNYKDERVAEVRREASRILKIWLDSNRELPDFAQPMEGSLLSAIQTAHPSSVRASVRREGLWDNLNYNHQVGFGVWDMVNDVVSDRIKGFREIASNIMNDPIMSDVADLVNQAVRIMETGREPLRIASQDFGRTIHAYDMRSDWRFWNSCDSEWGKGPGYRDRVLGHNRTWFDRRTDGDEGLKNRVRKFVEEEWKDLLMKVESILG